MDVDVLKRVPVREQEPKVRATNFEEVCYGYDKEEAMAEASRCLNCKNAQCVKGCPVSINIPAFVEQVKNGDFTKAYEIISESSALPAVCGRVCPQESQCEGKCIRGFKGDPVSIGKLERFVADTARENGIKPKTAEKKNGIKVAVIGSGPAGLTCAGDLAKLGYDVTIFEALHAAGGVLSYGIPEFRLPKDKVVAAEVENVKSLGVKIETNVVIGKSVKIDELMEKEGYEAVFIGSGAGLPRFMGIPGEQANGVFSANEFLTRNNLMKAYKDGYETPISKGKKVVVVGGGNVAMDAARTALRLGAETHIVYRRGEEELPARKEEVHHAKEEGIIFDLLQNPTEIIVDENGWVKGIKIIKMELGEPDESGRRRPVEIEGSEYEMECDTVIMSLGTSPNPLISSTTIGLDINKRKCIVATEDTGATSKEGVYAGGDAVTGAATVILAMGAGKAAAKGIHEFLSEKHA
ncbi:MAG: NADPH-dependent glutamate synthase [Agathobacter sp.]|mgnify:FL=1|nr:NADPH-dependent glutamate synthase [uncultured Agathobacter sp.]MEE1035424.1 NADPH-dependent glutamate synthase [Agathobacter sp.]